VTPLLELATACTLMASGPDEAGWRADLRVGAGCREAVVVAPPGLAVLGIQGRARLSDDTRRPMGAERFLPAPRAVDGAQRTRILFPDLLPGDVVFLTVRSAPYTHVGGQTAGSASVARKLTLTVPDGQDPLVALLPGQGAGWTTEDTWTLAASEADRAWYVPAGANAVVSGTAITGAGRVALTGAAGQEDGVWLLAGPGEEATFQVVTRGNDPPLCGRTAVPGVANAGFSVAADGATIEVEGGWWRVTSWNGSPIYDEPARTVAILHARYRSVSLPEPGLPMRVRGRLDGWSLAGELAPTLRQRAFVAYTATDPLWPRPLARARRSGIVSPLEAALTIRAYALQGRFEADWALVTPVLQAPPHPACPEGRPEALVRILLNGEERWVDPACTACGPFEVRPELLGAPALGPWVVQTPEPPRGRLLVQVAGLAVDVTLEGPAALDLRRQVESLPQQVRAEAIAETFAGPGATLADISGFTQAGAPIQLRALAANPAAIPGPEQLLLPPAWPDGSLWFHWLGERTFVHQIDGGSTWDRATVNPASRRLSAAEAADLRTSFQPAVLTTP
jgi:hypothetical protein